jgi:hypothetical protein
MKCGVQSAEETAKLLGKTGGRASQGAVLYHKPML